MSSKKSKISKLFRSAKEQKGVYCTSVKNALCGQVFGK